MLKKTVLALVVAIVVVGYFALGGEQYISVGYFQQAYLQTPVLTAGLFFVVYFLMAAFSLPAAALLTVIAGMIFGLATGTVLVSFASSLGATTACLFSRFLLRDWVSQKLGNYTDRINSGLEKEGVSYLFTLRLIPVFPFWVLNLVFGLTRMPVGKFYLVSQLGMLPGTIVYVNAGAQLGAVDEFSLGGVLSPEVLAAFILLAIFPYISKLVLTRWQQRKLYQRFIKPKRFDTNMIVIGAGSGGLVTAYLAAALKARVTLVEKHLMGGDCLNTGCVPSKALIRAAKAAHEARSAAELGVDVGEVTIDFTRVMDHVKGAIKAIEPHDSIERYTGLGVDCLIGEGKLVSPWEVEVEGKSITARTIVIASGGRPRVPDIPGLESIDYLTSENLWSLSSLPDRLLILGGGPIGCEMAQAFQRLGSQVTLVQRRERLLPKAEQSASRLIEETLVAEGVVVLTGWQVEKFVGKSGSHCAITVCADSRRDVEFDRVLLALGRDANTANLGLELLDIPCREDGTIVVDQYQRTRYPNIFACGDVCGPFQFTHASAHQAWFAAVNGLFGSLWKFKIDYRLIPSVIYTAPEVASVGLTEEAAKLNGVEFEVTQYSLSELDRAITDCETSGFVKILTYKGKDKILGVSIVSAHAGEMLMEFISAMKYGKGLNGVLGTIHPYPVFSEANKAAAGQWKRNHTPGRLLEWVKRYHHRRLDS